MRVARLVRLEPPTGATQWFSYDPDGKRVAKEDASGLVRYVYQRDNMLELLQERDGAGNLLAHYTLGDGLESQRRGEVSSFYHYDWLGSTQELTDAAQVVTDTYRYDAWGNVLEPAGSTVNPHTYVGRLRYYAMAGTGLYHLGYRELAGGVGRFLSADPASCGSSIYPYADDRPTAFADPSGLLAIDIPLPKDPIEWKEAAGQLAEVAANVAVVAAAIAVIAKATADVVRNLPCTNRHPFYRICRGIKDPRIAAFDTAQADPWRKPNLPNRSKWFPLTAYCKPSGQPRQGGLDPEFVSQLFVCPVTYGRVAAPHDQHTMAQSVVCESCCNAILADLHCIRVHHSFSPPPGVDWA